MVVKKKKIQTTDSLVEVFQVLDICLLKCSLNLARHALSLGTGAAGLPRGFNKPIRTRDSKF
jgi:hypothetical protein